MQILFRLEEVLSQHLLGSINLSRKLSILIPHHVWVLFSTSIGLTSLKILGSISWEKLLGKHKDLDPLFDHTYIKRKKVEKIIIKYH